MIEKNRFLALVLAFIASLSIAAIFAGCQTAAPESKFIGEWDIVGLDRGEQGEVSLDELFAAMRQDGGELSVSINQDGTAELRLVYDKQNDTSKGTWKLKDNDTITLTLDEVESDASIDGQGHLVFSQDGLTMTCQKRSA